MHFPSHSQRPHKHKKDGPSIEVQECLSHATFIWLGLSPSPQNVPSQTPTWQRIMQMTLAQKPARQQPRKHLVHWALAWDRNIATPICDHLCVFTPINALLCGCGSWEITARSMNKLQKFHKESARRMGVLTRQHHMAHRVSMSNILDKRPNTLPLDKHCNSDPSKNSTPANNMPH